MNEKYNRLEDEYRDLVWEEKEKGYLSYSKQRRLEELEDLLPYGSIIAVRVQVYPEAYNDNF